MKAHLQGSDGALLSPQQEVVLTCSSGRWDRSVTCDPVDCGVPDQSHVYYAEFSCPKGTTYLQRCSFSCIHPAKLQGTVWSAEGFKLSLFGATSSCLSQAVQTEHCNFKFPGYPGFSQLGGLLRDLPKWWASIPLKRGHHSMGIISSDSIPWLAALIHPPQGCRDVFS